MNLKQLIEENEKEFVEAGANLEHDRWARWQKYVHILFPTNPDGSITISEERVTHWERQIKTPYAELSELEKEYDRQETRNYLPLLRSSQLRLIEEVKRMCEGQEVMGIGGDFGVGFEAGYKKAKEDIISNLEVK